MSIIVYHQNYLHTGLRALRRRSPDKHLPAEIALFPYVCFCGFRFMEDDHYPPGPVGPRQGRGILRLGGILDIVCPGIDSSAKDAARS